MVQQLHTGSQDVWQSKTMHKSGQVVIKPVHRGLILNNILLRLAGMKYFTSIGANSGYHDLKLDD